MLQMITNSSIEPAFIELVGGRVFPATRSVEDELDAWIKKTQTRRYAILGRYARSEALCEKPAKITGDFFS
jgi:hypothetical protein